MSFYIHFTPVLHFFYKRFATAGDMSDKFARSNKYSIINRKTYEEANSFAPDFDNLCVVLQGSERL